jgi:uncharacterized protein (TIGR00725 family)
MMQAFSKTIAVYGSSTIAQHSPEAQQAWRLGQLLAQAKFIVCNGGYGGAMEAASRGASEQHGEVIGVVCDTFSHREPNPYLTKTISTATLPERLMTLMQMGDAYLILDGNIGTLAELFVAWNLAATGSQKPVLVVGEAMKKGLESLRSFTEIGEPQLRMLTFIDTVDDAVHFLNHYFDH